MNPKIVSVRALEILDSRGNPTLKVFVALDNGMVTSASVPSGASTGENEACELRDDDPNRYGGKGVLRAVANVTETIAPELIGMDPVRQAEIDWITSRGRHRYQRRRRTCRRCLSHLLRRSDGWRSQQCLSAAPMGS